MQPFFSSNTAVYGKPSTGTDEADVLQTDVMRFMAILGICLMVIFALVKAIPMTPPDTPPVIEPPESLHQEIQALTHKIESLKTELAVILSDVENARQQRKQAVSSLVGIRKELEKSRQNLAAVGKALEERKTSFSEVRKEVKKEAVNIRNQVQALARERKVEPAPPPENTTQHGFVLRFVSDNALTSLVEKGDIRFYAMIGKNARQLKVKEDHAYFNDAPFPASFYEMAYRTVPEAYIAALKRNVVVMGENVTWGVTLPETIRNRINMQMAGKTGGALIIHETGQVTYHKGEGL